MSMSTTQPELLCRTEPLNESVLATIGLDKNDVTMVEMPASGELYGLVCADLVKNSDVHSYTLDVGRCGGDEEDDARRVAQAGLGLGLASFAFAFDPSKQACSDACSDVSDNSDSSAVLVKEKETTQIYALHQTLGEPVGTDCGARMFQSLVLIVAGKNKIDVLRQYMDDLLAQADKTSDHKFTCYRWHVQYQYWRSEERAIARPLESVVLPADTKERLVSDLDDFVASGTRKWYQEHGIPYKRAYLLHGKPGAGKTSLIQALAGRYKRNLALLAPSHPEMTDDGLKAAVQRVPHKSIIVLEDVDALFGEGRQKKDGDKSSLTFSGVLNALDGVGGCSGQIFILTTNHRERLDPALVRNGRVDMHVEFKHADAGQMKGLFSAFYKDASAELAQQFATGLQGLLGERTVSAAQLQHYFITMRKKSAAEASAGFAKILEEAEAHGQLSKDKEAAKKAEEEKEGKKEAENEGGQTKQEDKATPSSSNGSTCAAVAPAPIHVHVHMPKDA